MAAGKKTGGRQKGTLNKATVVREEEIAATGELPRDYMLRVMRDATVEHQRRDDMAKAAAPYIHAKPSQSVELSGPDGGPIETVELTPTEAGRRIAFALARAQRSKPDTPKDSP